MLKITQFFVVVQLPSFANPDLSSILNSSNSISPDPSLSISRISPTMSIVIWQFKPNNTDYKSMKRALNKDKKIRINIELLRIPL